MNLPTAPAAYDRGDQNNLRAAVQRSDRENRKSGRDVEVAGSERLIMSSPDGNRWVVQVDNAGVLSAAALP